MGFKKFSLFIIIRTALAMLTLVLLSLAITTQGYHAATILLVAILIFQGYDLTRFVTKTNAELSRFLDAARYADYSQRFELNELGSGFSDLGTIFTDILNKFQTIRAEQEKKLRHLKAMVEHVPVPLMSVHSDNQITLWNNSARRLFGTNPVNQLTDLTQFGEEFSLLFSALKVGERRLVDFVVDGMEHQLTVSATQIIVAGRAEMLVSMQDIQSELDGAQLQAWQDLVRVLTHEIMNSITPVASLAKTAVDLVDDAKDKVKNSLDVSEELTDIASAVNTVARRSDGLMHFVGSYRRLTRLPPPTKKLILVRELFDQVSVIASQNWQQKNIKLAINIQPIELDLNVDIDMLEQLLINLLQNAEQAVNDDKKTPNPQVKMSAFLNRRGHVVIEVEDNGTGVPDDITKKIFVPFFTTKKEGSGVGLALTRQVMIAHGGSVKLGKGENSGALFTLTF